MFLLSVVLTLLALGQVNAHVALQWPYPFRAAYNPNSVQATIDYSITSPLTGDGSNFPCKGYQVDLGTPGGASVVTWDAGSNYNFSVVGSAVHGGGSCQASLSYDKGVSFTVIHSYQGSCPLSSGEAFEFTVPSDAKAGAAMFAWTWYNEIGNREIYMDCASVTINAASGSAPSTAFSARPGLFIANLGNGCTTVEGKEVQFPDPGPDVTNKYTVADDSGSFTGTCQAVKGIGGGGSAPAAAGGSSSATSAISSSLTVSTSSSTPTTLSTIYSAASSTSTASLPGGVFATIPASSSASATPSTGSSSGLTVTEDGECSGTHTCEGSIHGSCCSQWGWCGNTTDYCGTGCQAGFGQCDSAAKRDVVKIWVA